VDSVSTQQLIEGLQDGRWETTDEVMGPGESRWTPFERHPAFEDAVQEMEEANEPMPEPEDPEEQRIDMNPLIDVCLVLLVFFILATSMAVLQKVIEMPQVKQKADKQIRTVRAEEVQQTMVLVKAKAGVDGKPIIEMDGTIVPLEEFPARLSAHARDQRKTEMILEATGLNWGTIVGMYDAAGNANIKKVFFVKPGSSSAPPQ
jgi:biopolymer transport protein ExbD